jgi:hypothetical protein
MRPAERCLRKFGRALFVSLFISLMCGLGTNLAIQVSGKSSSDPSTDHVYLVYSYSWHQAMYVRPGLGQFSDWSVLAVLATLGLLAMDMLALWIVRKRNGLV